MKDGRKRRKRKRRNYRPNYLKNGTRTVEEEEEDAATHEEPQRHCKIKERDKRMGYQMIGNRVAFKNGLEYLVIGKEAKKGRRKK